MADINVNPQILPSRKAGSAKEHNKIVTVAVWAAVAAVLIGGVYWWQVRQSQEPVLAPGDTAQADALAVIRGSPVQVTSEDVARSLKSIDAADVSVSDADRQKALQELQTRLNSN